MPSTLSSLGFNVNSKEDFIDLFKLAYKNGDMIEVEDGYYVKWSVDEHVELYGQFNKDQEPIGINPHFFGSSRQTVKLEEINKQSNDTILDGGFLCWADPSEDGEGGIFPFIFDCPDINRHKDIKLPQNVEIQIAAIAREANIFESEEEFLRSQKTECKFASESFIPCGMFNEEEQEAMAIINGHIISAHQMTNALTKLTYNYVVLEVQGCRFDVIIDNDLLDKRPKVGDILSGTFWLSGIITNINI